MKRIIVLIPICFLCIVFQSKATENIYWQISKDILSRMERDFFHSNSESENIEKIMKDSLFNEVELNENNEKEIIVKLNWFSKGNIKGIPKGYNYVRGAQGQGDWYIYAMRDSNPVYIGTIQGGSYKVSSTTTNGYKDLEAFHHLSAFETILRVYKFDGTRYQLASSSTIKTENRD